MATTIPISKTNIVLLVVREEDWGVTPSASSASKKLAYNANGLARQQALEANVELRGERKQGALVPGTKNPSGPINGHQTDATAVLFYEAMLGGRVTTEIGAAGCTASAALAGAGAGLVTSGTHSYKIVVTKGALGYTLPCAKSNVVTTIEGSNGKVNVTRSGGTLPTGWTWDVYRTIAGDTGAWKKVNATGLGAAVTVYLDNIPDGSLGADAPSASTKGDYEHVLTVADELPSYTFERQHPYRDATFDYVLAKGCVCDTGRVAMKATGFDDFDGAFLTRGVTTEAASFELGTPTDWRSGEKLHHAMIGAGKVKMDEANFVGYLVDLTYAHNNNLDKTDFPMGMQGDRGSAVPLQSVAQVTGNIKVSDKSVLPLLQDYSVLHEIEIEHDFATFGHKKIHKFHAVQFEPTDAPVSGQGILTVPFTGHVVQDPVSGEQTTVTIVNGEPTGSYDHP